MDNWQDMVNDVAGALNSATSVAGNIVSTVQSLRAGTYLNQQAIDISQQQSQVSESRFNKLFYLLPLSFVVFYLLIKK